MEANFAFTIYSQNWTHNSLILASKNETLEDYVSLTAALVSHVVEKGTLTYDVQELDLHPCNSDDVFFQPDTTIYEGFKGAFPLSKCLTDSDKIQLWGN